MRNVVFAMAGALTWFVSTNAVAQDIGSQGQFAVGAERLFGIVYATESSEEGDVEVTQSSFNVTLMTSPMSSLLTHFSFPRIGLDYFVAEGLSLGGSVGVFSASITSEVSAAGQSQESDSSVTGFLVAPRIGYAVMFNDTVGLWPRGGITYVSATATDDDDDETTSSALALTAEVPLLIAPAPNVAFTVGPTLDLGLSATSEFESGGMSVEQDSSPMDIGVQTGLTVFF